MKTETAAYRADRIQRAVEPVYILRFFHVPDYGKAPAYVFSRDFVSRPVQAATMPGLVCIERIGGGPGQIVPEQGRASIGGFQVECTDLRGEVLRYFANLQLTTTQAMGATTPGAGEQLHLNDVMGLPEFGTIEVGTGSTLERIRYSKTDRAAKAVILSARGVDGTVAQAHAEGVFATNGEQIRPGQRCHLLSGYAGMAEGDFMASQVVEIMDRSITDITKAAFTIDTSDITRALRREVFLTATQAAPVVIGGLPLLIALRVMLSTGTGTNGPYDVLAAENGLGIPQAFIDVAGFEAASAGGTTQGYCFRITGPEIAKTWLEQEIFKTLNAYPLVRQDGSITIKLYTPVLTA